MKSNYRFHLVHIKQKIRDWRLISAFFSTVVLIAAQIINPAYSLQREAELLDDYNSLEDLVRDIKNGDVDFKDLRDSDGIPLKVMKDSEIYGKLTINMQQCIDLAGKVGNELGDREIVHCSEDSSYFKNKYTSNKGPLTSSASSSPSSTNGTSTTQNDTSTYSKIQSPSATLKSTSDITEKSELLKALVKTGKFTEYEATEFVIIQELLKSGLTEDQAAHFATKIMERRDQQNALTDDASHSSEIKIGSGDDNNNAAIGDTTTTSTSSPESDTDEDISPMDSQENNVEPQTKPEKPEDYDDLSRLVVDIKSNDLDADDISLQDFQNSGAYKASDEQTQACIDLGGKVGNNLGDYEQVHCSEDPNYFKDKYSTVSSSSTGVTQVSPSNVTDAAADGGSVVIRSDTVEENGTISDKVEDDGTSTDTAKENPRSNTNQGNGTSFGEFRYTLDDATKSRFIEELVKSGKFTEKEALDFAAKSSQFDNQLTPPADDLPAIPSAPEDDDDAADDLPAIPSAPEDDDDDAADRADLPTDLGAEDNSDDLPKASNEQTGAENGATTTKTPESESEANEDGSSTANGNNDTSGPKSKSPEG